MNIIADKIFTFINDSRLFIIALAAVAVFLNGMAIMWPSERSREKGKEAFPFVIAGAIICLSAVAIAKKFTSGF
ncbi:MAG: hypothetical protein SOR72_04355 [Hornefia sp.]|nr:hypothetical protein [Hornefia sp.]